MPTSRAAVAICFSIIAAGVARAAPTQRFDIPAGPLEAALVALAREGGVNVGTAELGLGAVRVPGYRGTASAATALAALLADTGYRAVRVAPDAFRIVRRRARPPAAAPRAPAPRAPSPAPPRPDSAEIVVVAGKRATSLLRFPGSVTLIEATQPPGVPLPRPADVTPIVQSTALGAGRDKMFVRGIADSSFAGPTQSTASIYFGDVQLGYNAPDPALDQHDVERIEILEGPQGTLYGAGAIGGVIRITPRAPDLAAATGYAALAATGTGGSGIGTDLSAMLNLPISRDTVGVRLLAYRRHETGFIDDPRRGLGDVNATDIEGGRAALRLAASGWTVDAGGIVQRTSAPDSQYATVDLPGLARESTIAQPFLQHYLLGRLIVAHDWASGLRLLAATGYVDRRADERYDATRASAPRNPLAYDTTDHNRLLTQELRLSRERAGGFGWVLGGTLLRDSDAVDRQFGPPGRPQDIVGVTNRVFTIAAFGEASVPIGRLTVTGGARVTRTQIDGKPTASTRANPFIPGRRVVRVDPTLGASLRIAHATALFARYETGYRAGGLAVASGVGRVAVFQSDTLHLVELGVRRLRSGPLGVSASLAVSHARWANIQADLVDQRGFPYTTNIGNGHINGLEAALDAVPLAGLELGASAFLNDNRLYQTAPGFQRARGGRLPDTPRIAANAHVGYRERMPGSALAWRVGAELRYAGRAQLGPAPLLDIGQGGTMVGSLTAGATRGRIDLSARLDNIADARGNRFALGNPFGVVSRTQYTPYRPRSLTLTATAAF